MKRVISLFLISSVWYQLLMVDAFCKDPINIDINLIAEIESNGNPDAVNKSSGARGLCQITYGVLKDYNKATSQNFHQEDLFNPFLNSRIANWYLNEQLPKYIHHFKKEDSITNRLIAYNWGIYYIAHGYKKMPKETKNYIEKYKLLLEERNQKLEAQAKNELKIKNN